MQPAKKSDLVTITVTVKADTRLSAALETEVATTLTDDGFEFSIAAENISDARARANTVLRSLIAAHNAGEAIGAWN